MLDTNSVHLAELLCQAYQETLQSFSQDDQHALAAAMPQDALVSSIMQIQATPVASEEIRAIKDELAILERQVAEMTATLSKYRAQVPGSLQACVEAVLANDAATLASMTEDKENAAGPAVGQPVELLPPSLPDAVREACKRLPVLRSELQVTHDRLARVLEVVELDMQRPPPNTVDRYVNQAGGRVSDVRSPGPGNEASLLRALASEAQGFSVAL